MSSQSIFVDPYDILRVTVKAISQLRPISGYCVYHRSDGRCNEIQVRINYLWEISILSIGNHWILSY